MVVGREMESITLWEGNEMATPIHGCMYADSVALPLVLTNAGTYYKLVSTAGVPLVAYGATGCIIDVSTGNGQMTIGQGGDGYYNLSYSISYYLNKNNVTAKAYLYVNGNQIPTVSSERLITLGSSVLASGTRGIYLLRYGDVIDFRLTCDTASTTATFSHVAVVLNRIN